MPDADNVAVVRRWTEQGFGEGRIQLADELVAEDFVNHNAMPGQVPGREGLKAAVAMLRTAFPDLSVSIEDVVAAGDRVVVRDWIGGTHLGVFAGLPPTGRSVRIMRIGVSRVVDGRIQEWWGLFDMFGAMQQLGAGAPPAGRG